MIRFLSSQGFLAAYSSVLTIVFLVGILCGFAKVAPNQAFDEITVHRINVVEPDGTIRLILTNTASSPGIYIKNKEYPHPRGRKGAGLLFFDEEEQRTADSRMVLKKTKAATLSAAMAI